MRTKDLEVNSRGKNMPSDMSWASFSPSPHPRYISSTLSAPTITQSALLYPKPHRPLSAVLPRPMSTSSLPTHAPNSGFIFSSASQRDHTHRDHTSGIDANVSIPHLRQALLCLDTKMASLMSQREELESHLEQAVRLQSPVLRLPSEILSSVFVIGVQGMGEEDSLLVSTLMLVCRYWANVAVGTPVLWSKIEVSKHHSLEKAKRKLARSKSVPLDITINFGPRPDQTSGVTECVIRAMDVFGPALWRTKSFRLSVPNRPQAHAALLRCQEDAPLLECLSIRIFHSIQEDHYAKNLPIPLFNGRTPRLRSCSFTSFNFGWDLTTVSNLRVLKLGGYFNGFSPSVVILLNILRESPQLEELAIRDMSDIDVDLCLSVEDEVAARVIQLPRLTKASFHCTGIIRSRMILSQLSFPALESLEFCYLNNVTPILQRLENQTLTSLPLRYLRIESCLFNELKFVNLLRRLPSVVTLELVDNEDVSSNFLRGLSTPAPSQRWICPKLETVNLDGCTSFEWDALRKFIESRLPAHSNAYPPQFLLRPPLDIALDEMRSASAYARSQAIATSPNTGISLSRPRRLGSIDVTRCHQISKEMVQWLRMYVADVRCEPAKGVWGEPVLP